MIAYRPAAPGDRAFIVDGWGNSFRTAHSAGMIDMDDWSTIMYPQIVKVLDRPDCRTFVACETDEEPGLVDLYGFIAGSSEPIWSPVARAELPLVFYAYVRSTQRTRGIATGLFHALGVDPSKPFVFTGKTSWCSLLSSKIPYGKWDPLLARFPRAPSPLPKVEYRRHVRSAESSTCDAEGNPDRSPGTRRSR